MQIQFRHFDRNGKIKQMILGRFYLLLDTDVLPEKA